VVILIKERKFLKELVKTYNICFKSNKRVSDATHIYEIISHSNELINLNEEYFELEREKFRLDQELRQAEAGASNPDLSKSIADRKHIHNLEARLSKH